MKWSTGLTQKNFYSCNELLIMSAIHSNSSRVSQTEKKSISQLSHVKNQSACQVDSVRAPWNSNLQTSTKISDPYLGFQI